MKRIRQKATSLRSQMIFSFLLLAIFAAIGIAIPAIYLIYTQSDRQAWAQIDQGVRATRALYAAQETTVTDLAKLTAQRPTLQALLAQGDQSAIRAYLFELQSDTDLDSITICNPHSLLIANTMPIPITDICLRGNGPEYLVSNGEESPTGWVVGTNPIADGEINLGKVITGIALDNEFANELRDQTGLDHFLLTPDGIIATSLVALPDNIPDHQSLSSDSNRTERNKLSFNINGKPYYATPAQSSSNSKGLLDIAALQVSDLFTTRHRLFLILIGIILMAAVLASILGTLLARRISQPLESLASSVANIRIENLDTPIQVDTHVWEVSEVAFALENSRTELQAALSAVQREKDWNEHLLASISEGIITLDHQGQILYFSPGAEQITGFQSNQAIHQNVDEIIRVVDGNEPLSSQIPSPGQVKIISVQTADHRQALLAISGAQFTPSKGGDSQLALVFRDVSQSEALNRLLGQFLGNVAHEFRTPLSALAASVELLEEEAADLSTQEAQELLNSLRLGILGLETLIDNLLESANLEAKRFRVSPRLCDIHTIISEAVQTMTPLVEKHHQQLHIRYDGTPRPAMADHRRTVQVVINLLSNAIKYGPSNSKIDLQVTTEPEYLKVAVSDRGTGISLEYQQDIFVRFMIPREVGEKAKPGAGLGLSVVKAIVEAQGGQVGVQNRPGGGATFWFTIPYAENP